MENLVENTKDEYFIKQILPYEEAKDLERLGYDKPTFAYHMVDEDSLLNGDADIFNINLYLSFTLNKSIYTLAPTYQQAFDWFRLEHDLVALPVIGSQEYSYNIWNDKKGEMVKESGFTKLGFNYNGTYEDARLESLRQLIKLVKNKKK